MSRSFKKEPVVKVRRKYSRNAKNTAGKDGKFKYRNYDPDDEKILRK